MRGEKEKERRRKRKKRRRRRRTFFFHHPFYLSALEIGVAAFDDGETCASGADLLGTIGSADAAGLGRRVGELAFAREMAAALALGALGLDVGILTERVAARESRWGIALLQVLDDSVAANRGGARRGGDSRGSSGGRGRGDGARSSS